MPLQEVRMVVVRQDDDLYIRLLDMETGTFSVRAQC
jgi:hypothetical protein